MENSIYEKKSLQLFTCKHPDWKSLAKDCIAFANAKGGIIAIGIEDNDDFPPSGQQIPVQLIDTIRERINELTINVGVNIVLEKAENGGEFIKIEIYPSASSVASTTDGQYYIRISDTCKPVLPDELTRLFTDKPAFNWETKVVQKVTIDRCDNSKLNQFVNEIRKSNRVSDFIKQKSTEELLAHYQMLSDNYLTNLGILWVGT
ncbi:MAG: ATP-binding protein [Bacteroidales bacterium]|nr:ATP-binding protein [Bacteroidales bacterium]